MNSRLSFTYLVLNILLKDNKIRGTSLTDRYNLLFNERFSVNAYVILNKVSIFSIHSNCLDALFRTTEVSE